MQYAISAGGGAFGAWTGIPSSRPGGDNAGGYEVPNLSSSTDYAFKLRYTIPSGNSFSPEVETSASTFEPFTGRMVLAFRPSSTIPATRGLKQRFMGRNELQRRPRQSFCIGARTAARSTSDRAT